MHGGASCLGAGHLEGRSKYLVGEAGDGLAPLPAPGTVPTASIPGAAIVKHTKK